MIIYFSLLIRNSLLTSKPARSLFCLLNTGLDNQFFSSMVFKFTEVALLFCDVLVMTVQ